MENKYRTHVARHVLCAVLVASGIGCSANRVQNPQAGGPPGMPVKVMEARAVAINDSKGVMVGSLSGFESGWF